MVFSRTSIKSDPGIPIDNYLVGGLNPSEKYESQLGWLETQYMGK